MKLKYKYLNNKKISLMIHAEYEGGNFAEKYIPAL